MRNKFFVYTSNVKKLPKGFLILIIILLLVLIPLLLTLTVVSLAGLLVYHTVKSFLPSKKKEKNIATGKDPDIIYLDENGNVIR